MAKVTKVLPRSGNRIELLSRDTHLLGHTRSSKTPHVIRRHPHQERARAATDALFLTLFKKIPTGRPDVSYRGR